MPVHSLDGLSTLVAALLAIALGRRLNRLVPWLERNNVPPAVSAGLVLSLALAGLRAAGVLDLKFAMAPRDALLLVFFASLGFGAHLGRLASAGKAALVDLPRRAARHRRPEFHRHRLRPAVRRAGGAGPFLGSIAYLGGHGTAVAWSNAPAAAALPAAFTVGIGSATLGLVLGGLAAGPVAMWLAQRGGDLGAAKAAEPGAGSGPAREPAFSSDRWLPCLFWIFIAMAVGPLLGAFAAARGCRCPAFSRCCCRRW